MPLADIARMDDVQIRWLYFRERGRDGRLTRSRKHPKRRPRPFNPASWEQMFRDVKRSQSEFWKGRTLPDGTVFRGYTEDDIERLWQEYLKDNPSLPRPDPAESEEGRQVARRILEQEKAARRVRRGRRGPH